MKFYNFSIIIISLNKKFIKKNKIVIKFIKILKVLEINNKYK